MLNKKYRRDFGAQTRSDVAKRSEIVVEDGRSWARASWVLLGLLALLYGASIRTYYVGYFNDDASYVNGARALVSVGRYVDLSKPTEPPIQYTPGYPLLLAPLAWLSGNAFLPFQIFSMLMTWAAMLIMNRLWEGEVSPAVRFGALILAGISPLTTTLSGAVMAEIPYFLLLAGLLWAASSSWERDGLKFWVCLGGVAGYGVLLRPNGIALPLSLAFALAFEKRWRPAAVCILTGLAPIGLFMLRNRLLTGVGSSYALELAGPFARSPLQGVETLGRLIGDNTFFYCVELFAKDFFVWPDVWGRPILMLAASGLGIAAVLTGAWRLRGSGWRRFYWLHAAVYTGCILIYYKQTDRYLFPLLMVFSTAFLQGLSVWEKRCWPFVTQAGRIFFLVGLVCAANMDRLNIQAALGAPTPLNTPPRNTFQWVRQSTGPADVFAAAFGPRLYLYTGRKAVKLPPAGNGFELAAWATASGVGYILVSGSYETLLKPASAAGVVEVQNPAVVERMLAQCPLFTEVFLDAAEQCAVFHLAAPLVSPASSGPIPASMPR